MPAPSQNILPDNTVRILLIEDDPMDAKLFKRRLGESFNGTPFALHTVARMADGILMLSKKPFDIIFLDLGLPDIHDLTAVSALRMACADIPVIVSSSADDLTHRKNAFLCGAQGYLAKNQQNTAAIHGIIQQTLPEKMV